MPFYLTFQNNDVKSWHRRINHVGSIDLRKEYWLAKSPFG